MSKRPEDDAEAGSSPACAMHEAGDVYMGYADREELIAFLNEMLEAERAGARIARESANAGSGDPLADLMRTVRRDEARWCAVLFRHVKALGAAPSDNIGAFYDKAMAIPDAVERLALLNRGQGWVVRKLRAMLPRVRSDLLHKDLAEMLQSHETNIALAEVLLGRLRNATKLP